MRGRKEAAPGSQPSSPQRGKGAVLLPPRKPVRVPSWTSHQGRLRLAPQGRAREAPSSLQLGLPQFPLAAPHSGLQCPSLSSESGPGFCLSQDPLGGDRGGGVGWMSPAQAWPRQWLLVAGGWVWVSFPLSCLRGCWVPVCCRSGKGTGKGRGRKLGRGLPAGQGREAPTLTRAEPGRPLAQVIFPLQTLPGRRARACYLSGGRRNTCCP